MQRELFQAHARLEQHHWWFTARREILRQLLHQVAPPGTAIPLVDFGCGTGGNVAAFAGEYDAIGVDSSPDALALARRDHPEVRFVEGNDFAAVAAHLRRGGVILLTDVLEHLVDDQALFDAAVTVLPAGGTLLITVPNDPSLWSGHDELFGHSRRYTIESLRALWRNAPVEERLLSPFNARLQPVIALIRRWRRDHRPPPGGDLGLSVGIANGMLRRIFSGEAPALVAAIDRHQQPYTRGVSLVAILRKR